MRRPVEVKQDVRQMEERRRVNMILKSRAFRHDLENIVEQLKAGPQQQQQPQQQTSSAQALQQITEMFPSQMRIQRSGPVGIQSERCSESKSLCIGTL